MYLKASYTVEGSMVISICLIIITMCILFGFDNYKESISYIESHPIKEIDAVKIFRETEVALDILNSVLNR